MTDWLIENEGAARLSTFFGIFALMAIWEATAPKRRLAGSKGKRWATNWLITTIDIATVRVLLVAIGVAGAWDAARVGFGLFNWLDWPFWVEVIITLIVLDLVIYWQHVLSHRIPLLWRFHRVHHADRDIDVSTAVRFHPVEIAYSMALKLGVVYLLGPPAIAVILFEAILNGAAMFNHSNVRISGRVERVLRWMIVTPDMHRVHHSAAPEETDKNFGFNLPWWDRLFGTYLPQPKLGHEGMTIGLNGYQDQRPTQFLWSLSFPFVERVHSAPEAPRSAPET